MTEKMFCLEKTNGGLAISISANELELLVALVHVMTEDESIKKIFQKAIDITNDKEFQKLNKK